MDLAMPKPLAARKRIPATRRERWAWYLYDFGNSAYAAVVLLAVYSTYFTGTGVGGAEGSRLWGLSVGIAMLVVAISSPVLGALADFTAAKKRFLFFFTAMACVFTALLFFVEKGNVFTGMLFFILAEIGYRASQVYYNALLPEIATPDEVGTVSGNGWAIGSAGGIVCLLIVLVLIMFVGGPMMVRLSFLITAVFFALSTLPLFLFIRERAEPQPLPAGENYFTVPFKQLWQTVKHVRNYKQFIKFIIAFLVYNDGILMTLDFAAIIGAVLFGLTQQQLIIFMIIVQVTSVIGAYLSGIAADRFGGKYTLVVSLVLMVISVSLLIFAQNLTVFFLIGALAGFALTGVQAVSRTMVSQLSPEGQSGEFYGFFAVAGRSSSFLGPTIYGWLAAEAALYFEAHGQPVLQAEQSGVRVGVLSIVFFLLIGLCLLVTLVKNVRPAEAHAHIGD
ncbi:MAG: MFS transporter [Anaerolineaceae bacterium]